MLHRRFAIIKYLRLILNFKSVILLNDRLLTLFLFRGIRFADRPKVWFHGGAVRYAFVLLFFALSTISLPGANAAEVTLAWDSNSEPDLEGYVVYRNIGSPGPPYMYSDSLPENDLVDPLNPMSTLTGLKAGEEYYIALTAYNTEGIESTFSNDICIEVVNNTAELCSTSSSPVTSQSASSGDEGGSSSGGGSGGGSGCFISSASQISLKHYRLWGMLLILTLIATGFCRQKKRMKIQ